MSLTVNSEILLSFVVPVYNVEGFIEDCLKSLLAQNVSKELYEIICVDDGSTDNSGRILDEYADINSNIKVIHSENKGVSAARNIGISASTGKYLWFVDSDDMIATNCLKPLFNIIIEKSPQCIRFNHENTGESDNFDSICSNPFNTFHGSIHKGRISGNHVWESVVKASIIKDNNIRFDEQMKFGEDTLFTYMIYANMPSDCWIALRESLYYYRTRKNSAVNTKTKERYTQQTKDLFRMAYTYKEILKNNSLTDGRIIENTKKRQQLATIGALTILPKSTLDYKETMRCIKEEKLYPFSFSFWNVRLAKPFKAKVMETIKLLFIFRPFYKVYYLLMKK